MSAATAWGFYLMARFVNHRCGGGLCCGECGASGRRVFAQSTTGASRLHCRHRPPFPFPYIVGTGRRHFEPGINAALRLANRPGPPHVRWHMTALEAQLVEAQAALEHERSKRKADRVGRIRAEQELRTAKVQLQQLQLQAQGQQGQGEQGAAEAAAGAAAGEGEREDAEAEDVDADGDTGTSTGAAANSTGRLLDDRKRAAAAAALAAAGAAMPAFPFRPIGHLQSVFSER